MTFTFKPGSLDCAEVLILTSPLHHLPCELYAQHAATRPRSGPDAGLSLPVPDINPFCNLAGDAGAAQASHPLQAAACTRLLSADGR